MRVPGKTTSAMERACSFGLMDLSSKANGKRMHDMDLEFLNSLMAAPLKVTGPMILCMEILL